MPTVTHSVIDPVGGQPVGVRSVEVRVVAPNPLDRVYRATDGFELAPTELVTLAPDGTGTYPATFSLLLADNASLLPAGSRYVVRMVLVGDDPRNPRGGVDIVVPAGVGPYRLVDLLNAQPDTVGALVPGVTPAGVYDAARTYYLRQIVTHQGSAYVARGTTLGVTPGTNPDAWQLLVTGGSGGSVDLTEVDARLDALEARPVIDSPDDIGAAPAGSYATTAALSAGLAGKADTNDTRITGAQPVSAKGQANGYASLGADGKVPQTQVPSVTLVDFLGEVASQPAMLALVGQRGDWCTRTDRGTDWQLVTEPSSALASWRERVYPASPVSSVNGRTGAVTGLAEATSVTAAAATAEARLMARTNWVRRDTAVDTTLVVGERLRVDATNGARAIALPTSPVDGDRCQPVKADSGPNPVNVVGTISSDPGGVQLTTQGASATLYYDGAGWRLEGFNLPSAAPTVDVQVFTTPGTSTWTKPAGATRVYVEAIAGGSGGGSGARLASGTASSGGSGGAGGGYSSVTYRAADLGATESITVGAGGAGGAAVTTDNTNGNAGALGAVTTFGASPVKCQANRGGAGGGGSTSAGSSASAGRAAIFGGAGGAAAVGASGNAGTNASSSGGGGSSGGGVTSAPAAAAGTFGNGSLYTGDTAATQGNASGGNGGNGASVITNTPAGGAGGAGGGANISGAAGAGGNGGNYGAGGGGGGSSLNGNASGKGGDGAPGIVVVTTWF